MTYETSLELFREDQMRKIAERKAKYQQLTGVEKIMIERDKAEAESTEDKILPSRFQIGDEVIIKAKVKGVQFVDGKVSYCFWLDDKLHTITSDHVGASNGILSVRAAE